MRWISSVCVATPVDARKRGGARAALAVIAFSAPLLWGQGARAGAWENKASGQPAITANAHGVSVVLPAATLSGDMTAQVKAFLEEWGPRMCSGVFDFNAPHKRLRVEVGIIDAVPGNPDFREVWPGRGQVVFDYKPHAVKCVRPEVPSS